MTTPASSLPLPAQGKLVLRPLLQGLKRHRSWLSTLALLALWQLAAQSGWFNPRALPAPAQIVQTAWGLLEDGTLISATSVSALRVLAGSLLGITLGLLLGLLSGFSRLGEDLIDKPMQMARTIPFTAMVPLFILWFGIDETPKVLLVALGALTPIYINTFGGIRNVDKKLVEVARVTRMSNLQIATHVLLPAALPSLLIGLRYALALGWIAVIVAETMGASSGIGYLMIDARQYARTDIMLVCVVLYAVLGLLTDNAVRRLEHYLLAWRQAHSG